MPSNVVLPILLDELYIFVAQLLLVQDRDDNHLRSARRGRFLNLAGGREHV
jgi:hypothetical protein